MKRIGQEGDIGIVHKSRGKKSRRKLKFRQINVRPERPQKRKVKIKRKTAYIPPAVPPWRKFKIGRNASKNIKEVAV